MIMEPEIVKTKRISEEIGRFMLNKSIDAEVKQELKLYDSEEKIPFRLVKHIYDVLSKSGEKRVCLHNLLEGSELCLPEFKPQPRNAELEARCQKLQVQADNKRYRDMVRNVDRSQKPDYFAAGKDVKEMNRQLVSVFNFIVTVGAAFAFGYKATQYTFGGYSNVFALQMIAALALATIVFFADLYFLLKESG